MMVEPLLFTPKETAQKLGVSQGTLEARTKAGAIKVFRYGRIVRYSIDAIRAYIDSKSIAIAV
jgi:excisionase family DNA binding protein